MPQYDKERCERWAPSGQNESWMTAAYLTEPGDGRVGSNDVKPDDPPGDCKRDDYERKKRR